MRGSIVKRSRWSWSLVIDQGRDPTTKRRKQRWVRFEVPRNVSQREATKQAEAKLAELLHQVDKGTYVDASKTTLVEHLRAWHAKSVVPHRRPETARIYLSMIDKHVAPSSIASLPLQKVRTSDLEHLYATVKLSPSSVTVLHAVIGRALKMAVRDKLLAANPAAAVEDRPRVNDDHRTAIEHCWSADEARRVMTAAKKAGTQASAFVALLLDTGARKSEALGLTWDRVDLAAGTVRIERQLEPGRRERPEWGPLKTKRSRRTVDLNAETVARLKAHKRDQAALKMANRTTYQDHGLVFAKEAEDCTKPTAALGQPCLALAGRHFRRVVKAAGVKLIKVHGTRHTAATLLLQAGVPVQVVAERLGHAQISMTLEVYAHALPGMGRDAAARLGTLLGG